LFELWLTLRNRRWALARGGVEAGQSHYPAMVALHTSLLIAAPLEVTLLGRPWRPLLGWICLALVALAMALRYWAIVTLGRRWSTRVVVVPGLPAVAGGPYRFVRHPNYTAVTMEGAALPLVHGAWLTALVFSALNVWILAVRIRCEEEALRRHSAYDERLAGRARFLPGA
jgi:methyltransferase